MHITDTKRRRCVLGLIIFVAIYIFMAAQTLFDLTTQVRNVLPHANGGTDVSTVGSSGNVLRSNGSIWQSHSLSCGDLSDSGTGCSGSGGSSDPSATYGGLIGGQLSSAPCTSAPWYACDSTAANHIQSFPSFWSELTQYIGSVSGINTGYIDLFEASTITAGQNFQNTTADFPRLSTGPVTQGVSYQEQSGVSPFNVPMGAFSYTKQLATLNGSNGGVSGAWSAITVGTTAQPYDWILSDSFTSSSTHYSGPGYKRDSGQTTEAKTGVVMPLEGAWDYLCTGTNGGQPVSGALVQTLDRTAAGSTTATSLVANITNGATSGNDSVVCDLTHTASVAIGDYYTWSWVNGATSTSTFVRATGMRFTPTIPKQTAIVWVLGTQTIGSAAYAPPAFVIGGTGGISPFPMPRSGTMDNLHCLLTTAPGTNPQAVTVYLDGVATALTLNLPTAGCTNSVCFDLTHSFSFTTKQGISLFFGSHTGTAPAVSSCSARIIWS